MPRHLVETGQTDALISDANNLHIRTRDGLALLFIPPVADGNVQFHRAILFALHENFMEILAKKIFTVNLMHFDKTSEIRQIWSRSKL